ncbi:tetratricopeptide repeat protein [Rasiella rasia]|uniref:Tetratricopeptide repeat protein n=1 Tax=Rasiella rasia TaxID=2744027 RepID=A0A6G6GN97_9FLAO|nr:tetratricopeptide repeat protein [Rasiella rasia]QIE60029.1 tetratricopeptide repeat protein [Rasiella rasia]
MKHLFFILVVLTGTLGWSQNNALFEQGKEHYKNDKFQEAINSWEKVLANGKHSSSLYFNLANANYKLNKVGPSIFYYEKALQLAPGDADIKTNLKFAENARIDAIEPLPKTIFSKWYHAIASLFTYNGWAKLAVMASIFFVLLFLSYWFIVAEGKKRLFFTTAMLSLGLLVVSTIMAFQTYADATKDKPAIVFAESSEARAEPKMGSEVAFVLHEGTKVQIISEEDAWVRVLLVNGKDGWIPSSDIKQL